MIDPVSLGATLYLPATRAGLSSAILGQRHQDLRSVVICLEDSVLPQHVPQALGHFAQFLLALAEVPEGTVRPLIFVRPRSSEMLAHLLGLPAIEAVDGFVIPKATADSLPDYLSVLSHDHHMLMPTLETREVFDPPEMRRLRDQLLAIQDRVLAVRIGGNDLLQTLGARRSATRTAYDGPLGPVIVDLVATYGPWGFRLSAPVFEYFGNPDLLREEVERDLEHGLLTKTAIHPSQIAIIQGAYAVDPLDLAEAQAILARGEAAVFASREAMCEPATHSGWAGLIQRRADHFGVKRPVMGTVISA
jgi:citrate lyase beta subunit